MNKLSLKPVVYLDAFKCTVSAHTNDDLPVVHEMFSQSMIQSK